jgi:hypothetical protein
VFADAATATAANINMPFYIFNIFCSNYFCLLWGSNQIVENINNYVT